MIAVVLISGYVIFSILKRKKIEEQILTDGYFYTAIIKEKVPSRFSSKTFVYRYSVKRCYYEDRGGMNSILSEKYNAGDTIIIKFLPNTPEKSMIIEEAGYKSCYGIPPPEGWKKLPECN